MNLQIYDIKQIKNKVYMYNYIQFPMKSKYFLINVRK